MINRIGLQGKLTGFITLLVCGTLALIFSISYVMLSDVLRAQKGEQALAVAVAVAESPVVIDAFGMEDPAAVIQPYAEAIREDMGAEYVVVGNLESVRYSHPSPEQIGQKMVGSDNDRALINGESYVSEATGTLGPAIRGKVPIFTESGEIIGVVSVGFLEEDVSSVFAPYHSTMLFAGLLCVALGVAGSSLIATRVKSAIFEMEPEEIAKELLEKQTILESIKEGIIAIDRNGAVTMINEQALALVEEERTDDVIGRPILTVLPNTRMLDVLSTGEEERDQPMMINGNEVIVNRRPLIANGTIKGVVASFRPKEEWDQLMEQLSQTSRYAESLRAQTHEHSNTLSALAGLIQTDQKEKALQLISAEVHELDRWVSFLMKKLSNPMMTSILIGKFHEAHERGIHFQLHPDSHIARDLHQIDFHHLVTIIGNLIDNAFDEVMRSPGEKLVELFVTDIGQELIIEVQDSGRGIPDEMVPSIFERGISTKHGHDRGYGLYLVMESVKLLRGTLTVDEGDHGGACFSVFIPIE